MVFTRKEVRGIATSTLLTIIFLFFLDKIFISFHLFDQNYESDLPALTSKSNLEQSKSTKTNVNTISVHGKDKGSSFLKSIENKTISNARTKLPSDQVPVNSYINQKSNTISIENNFATNFNHSIKCPDTVKESYAKEISKQKNNLNWCQTSRDKYKVVIGLSWGGLPSNLRKEWDINGCNDLLKLGKLQTCNEKFGWNFFTDWIAKKETIIDGKSTVKCAPNLQSTIFCQSLNIVIDFSKAEINGQTRMFKMGFVQAFGKINKDHEHLLPDIPGFQHIQVDNNYDNIDMRCDIIEDKPTYILSNDDIFNLGHYINDVMMIWSMVVLSNHSPKDSILINMDGIRKGGPAGGPHHRIMDHDNPDNHGPYAGYYQSWFKELKRGVDYGNKRVCFKEAYFQLLPG